MECVAIISLYLTAIQTSCVPHWIVQSVQLCWRVPRPNIGRPCLRYIIGNTFFSSQKLCRKSWSNFQPISPLKNLLRISWLLGDWASPLHLSAIMPGCSRGFRGHLIGHMMPRGSSLSHSCTDRCIYLLSALATLYASIHTGLSAAGYMLKDAYPWYLYSCFEFIYYLTACECW